MEKLSFSWYHCHKHVSYFITQRKANVMDRERLHYLDAARGLAILLVVLGHIWETDQAVPVLIYSFHIPLFFLISGILIAYTDRENRPAKQLVLSGLRSLIVPYVFFEAVFILIFGLRNHFDFSSSSGQIYSGLLLSPQNVPLWFLPTLFLTELFFLLLLRLICNRSCVAVICLLLYLLPFVPEIGRILPAPLLRCLSSLGFLAVGYFSANLVRAKNPPVILLLLTAVASGALALINGKTGIYKLSFRNPLLFTVCALTGSYCVIFLLKKLSSKDSLAASGTAPASPLVAAGHALSLSLELAGRNSLVILGLHIIVLRVLQEILGLHTDSIAGGLLALAGICLLLTPACWFFNRFLPFFIGKQKKPLSADNS